MTDPQQNTPAEAAVTKKKHVALKKQLRKMFEQIKAFEEKMDDRKSPISERRKAEAEYSKLYDGYHVMHAQHIEMDASLNATMTPPAATDSNLENENSNPATAKAEDSTAPPHSELDQYFDGPGDCTKPATSAASTTVGTPANAATADDTKPAMTANTANAATKDDHEDPWGDFPDPSKPATIEAQDSNGTVIAKPMESSTAESKTADETKLKAIKPHQKQHERPIIRFVANNKVVCFGPIDSNRSDTSLSVSLRSKVGGDDDPWIGCEISFPRETTQATFEVNKAFVWFHFLKDHCTMEHHSVTVDELAEVLTDIPESQQLKVKEAAAQKSSIESLSHMMISAWNLDHLGIYTRTATRISRRSTTKFTMSKLQRRAHCIFESMISSKGI